MVKLKENLHHSTNLKYYSQIQASSLWHQSVDVHVRSLNPKFEPILILCIANAKLTSMLKILSDLIINHTIGSPAKINNYLQLRFRIAHFLSLYHQINTK